MKVTMAKKNSEIRELLRRRPERGKTVRGSGKLLLPDSSGIFWIGDLCILSYALGIYLLLQHCLLRQDYT